VIVPLVKLSLCGLLKEKAKVLADLQDLGCLHLIPLSRPPEHIRRGGPSSAAREALKFLLDCSQKRRQIRESAAFDPVAVENRALELKERIQELEDERDFLRRRLADLKPWGDFTFPCPEDIGGLRLWFYAVPSPDLAQIPADLIYQVVNRDNRFAYIVVLSAAEPRDMPVRRIRAGSRSPRELEDRLEAVELELEDLQAERSSLTRWCTLFARSLARLEDEAAIAEAAGQTLSEAPLFALQAWAPEENLPQIRRYADNLGLVLEVKEPEPGETPPTLLRNPPAVASGQDLVSFYTTPGYWDWDPSAMVFFSFALFFAMIVADAGYGLLLGIGVLLGWRRLGQSPGGRRFRLCLALMAGATVVYGALVNSYFGVAWPSGSLPARLGFLNLNDFNTMMGLSVAIGVLHLIMANAANAWSRRRSRVALAPVGWILVFVGAVLWGLSALKAGPAGLKYGGMVLMAGGGVGVLLFTTVEGPLWRRLLGGLKGLARLSNAFGDTLSYLRLFALGLASASLAVSFNSLAKQVHAAFPGLGLFFALLIILLGHALNLTLALASGFIHGLRLNFIEFFNWGLTEEGYRFQAFARKEKS